MSKENILSNQYGVTKHKRKKNWGTAGRVLENIFVSSFCTRTIYLHFYKNWQYLLKKDMLFTCSNSVFGLVWKKKEQQTNLKTNVRFACQIKMI